MKICVEIIVINDLRIRNTLSSLKSQTKMPDRVFIADGGSQLKFLDTIKSEYPENYVDIKILTGSIIETRAKSLEHIDEEITVFLDADQIAPPEWLEILTSPLLNGDEKLAYTGGPTKPYKEAKTSMEKYVNLMEEHIYSNDLSKSLAYIPLGNTAWKTAVLKELGFDRRLKFEAEDNDLETRAYKAGYHGLFIKDAWVWHDKTSETKFLAGMRKRYRYLVGAATVFLKNGTLRTRSKERRKFVNHPYAVLELFLKPLALLHAFARWHLVIKRKET